jgi:predicted Zn-dependent protease
MSILPEAQSKAILQKVVALSTADETYAQLDGMTRGNVRFARNDVSTAGVVDNIDLQVQVAFGKRTGVATINQFDDASLERVVRRAEALARLAPENPEYMSVIEPEAYVRTSTFSASTAAIDPAYRAKVASDSIQPCKAANLVAAGYLEDAAGFTTFLNSKGAYGYQTLTSSDYTCTVRTEDGTGSGWVGHNVQDVDNFKASDDIAIAMRKASASANARALEPGKYTVILEPAAAAGLVGFMMNFFDARSADEGRSFLSKAGGGNKIGEQVFGPEVTMFADPQHAGAEAIPWDNEGMARKRLPIIENGVVKNLQYTRYWAQKQGVTADAGFGNLIMVGGDKSTADLIRTTERGILVSRTWYIRLVDPQTVLLTGLTRDGTFYIENGEIKYPIKNFRFNESPVIMLNNVEEFGRSVRVQADEGGPIMVLPPMKLRDFTFTSLSDAV